MTAPTTIPLPPTAPLRRRRRSSTRRPLSISRAVDRWERVAMVLPGRTVAPTAAVDALQAPILPVAMSAPDPARPAIPPTAVIPAGSPSSASPVVNRDPRMP
jgi:hypothetical protein